MNEKESLKKIVSLRQIMDSFNGENLSHLENKYYKKVLKYKKAYVNIKR